MLGEETKIREREREKERERYVVLFLYIYTHSFRRCVQHQHEVTQLQVNIEQDIALAIINCSLHW